jgi:O-methyltransferase
MAVINNQNLLSTIAKVAFLSGDFIEIGVFKGDTFKRLALISQALGKKAHGFDSFEGMESPTELDFGYYPKGKLNVGGINSFIEIMDTAKISSNSYELYAGWIPDCFDGFKNEIAFALIDVDQYQPTVPALEWVWAKLQVGGIMLLDDYFRNREGLASLAIEEWLLRQDPYEVRVIDYIDTQLYIQKCYTLPNKLPIAKTST